MDVLRCLPPFPSWPWPLTAELAILIYGLAPLDGRVYRDVSDHRHQVCSSTFLLLHAGALSWQVAQ